MGASESKRFIPDQDHEFATMGRLFAQNIAQDPSRYQLSAQDAEQISAAVTRFREALAVALRPGTRTKISIMQKDSARKDAESMVRKYARLIRANSEINPIDRFLVRIGERPERLGRRACPQEQPVLTFVESIGPSQTTGRKHVLRFMQEVGGGTRAKPAGAVRLELAVELVAPGEPIPKHPGELSGGRIWYLGSFSRNPIEVEFPEPATPMLIVYWGRWASATNEVGPWSSTCQARVEGWTTQSSQPSIACVQRRMAPQLVNAVRELPDLRPVQHEEQRLLPEYVVAPHAG